MSKREFDLNGWFEVKGNPLSKVGVYPYTGAMIDSTGEFGLDPDKIYNVLRSEDELSDPECIDSFKLSPWIDNHEMLGEGFTPAEKKGVQGVIGEDVYFDKKEGMLRGNIKVFTESLKKEIDGGKKELSLGYRCKYVKKDGIANGTKYEFSQTQIRGNHLATVDQGRMGAEVAVLDGDLLTFTLDSKELVMTPEEMEKLLTELMGSVKTLMEKVEEFEHKSMDEGEEEAEDMKEGEDAEECEDEECAEDEEKEGEGMDSLKADNEALKKQVEKMASTLDSLEKDGMKTLMGEIGKRDALAAKISDHVGTFDHSEMTLAEVAVYGADKLGLDCKGSELATITGYLHGRKPATASHGLDNKEPMDELKTYLEGAK